MFGWLKKFTGGDASPDGGAKAEKAPGAAHVLTLKDDEISVDYPGQPRVKASLAEVAEVLVETSEEAPELWWLLLGDRGQLLMQFPGGAAGEEALVARLKALPGFEEAKFDDALACEVAGEFVVWRRG